MKTNMNNPNDIHNIDGTLKPLMPPKLLGQSGPNLQLTLVDEAESHIWHKLMDENTPRVCPHCGKPVQHEKMDCRIDYPLYPDKTPVAMATCIATCPHCRELIHEEFAEMGYPFNSAEYLRRYVIAEIEKRTKAKNEKG